MVARKHAIESPCKTEGANPKSKRFLAWNQLRQVILYFAEAWEVTCSRFGKAGAEKMAKHGGAFPWKNAGNTSNLWRIFQKSLEKKIGIDEETWGIQAKEVEFQPKNGEQSTAKMRKQPVKCEDEEFTGTNCEVHWHKLGF